MNRRIAHSSILLFVLFFTACAGRVEAADGVLASVPSSAPSTPASAPALDDQQRLGRILNWVWDRMNTEYYEPVSREIYENFLRNYPVDKIRMMNEKSHQTEDFVHLGAGLLVQKLKKPTDRFSNFVPPKKAVAFKQEAYAARADLGLEGRMTDLGYELTHVQKHCPAFAEFVRPGDTVLSVDGTALAGLTLEKAQDLLRPEVGKAVRLSIRFAKTGNVSGVTLTAGDYFAETVQTPDSGVEGALILRIDHFNEKTGADAADALTGYGAGRIRHLIVDLRQNKGGPPLATRDVLGMFTRPKDPLFIIARRGKQPVLLSSDASDTHYAGPITVLTSPGTASAAETLAGVLREKLGARIVGQKTFGACYLKSMYDYDDGSTMLLVTSKTYYHNRKLIPEDGIAPDITVPDGADALEAALKSILANSR